ncbi:MAG: sel1 repeat family protein, partial [Opitutales bacterium]|nr:sel1 repeat family protein [Opitutales bacterium]
MTYFEQGLHFFEAGKLEEARKYFGYAKNFGSENEKQRATEILEQIDAGTANVDSLVHENALARTAKTLLEEKRYALALEKLLALGDSASAEELYYLGVLHDDFGMGMPNDPEKARAYFKKSFDLGYADAAVGYAYVGADDDEDVKPLSTEQRTLLEKAAKRGNVRAEAWLLIDDLVVCLKE